MLQSAAILLLLAAPGVDFGKSAADRVRLLKHKDADVRAQAAMFLAHGPRDRVLAALLGALRDPASNVRLQAAMSLQVLQDERAVPFLARRLKEEGSSRVLVALLGAVGATGATYAGRSVEPFLDHPSRDVRGAAVLALGRVGDPGQRAALWAALRYAPHDPGFHVRCAVLGAFVNLGWQDDARRALDELEEQGALRHWYARAAMSSAVGIAGFEDRLDWVRKILEDSEDARVIAAATEALARLGAREEVKARVTHESPLVRRAALSALQEVGDVSAVPLALERIRDDADPSVRFEAVLVLYRVRYPGVDVYLVDALKARNPIFWITALTALERRHGRSFGRDPDAWAAWLKKRRPAGRKK